MSWSAVRFLSPFPFLFRHLQTAFFNTLRNARKKRPADRPPNAFFITTISADLSTLLFFIRFAYAYRLSRHLVRPPFKG